MDQSEQESFNWRDRQWLEQNQLTELTAIDYFSGSHFYDKQCINETEKDPEKQKKLKGICYYLSTIKKAGTENVYIIEQVKQDKSFQK